jgi:hypothetical protein
MQQKISSKFYVIHCLKEPLFFLYGYRILLALSIRTEAEKLITYFVFILSAAISW